MALVPNGCLGQLIVRPGISCIGPPHGHFCTDIKGPETEFGTIDLQQLFRANVLDSRSFNAEPPPPVSPWGYDLMHAQYAAGAAGGGGSGWRRPPGLLRTSEAGVSGGRSPPGLLKHPRRGVWGAQPPGLLKRPRRGDWEAQPPRTMRMHSMHPCMRHMHANAYTYSCICMHAYYAYIHTCNVVSANVR